MKYFITIIILLATLTSLEAEMFKFKSTTKVKSGKIAPKGDLKNSIDKYKDAKSKYDTYKNYKNVDNILNDKNVKANDKKINGKKLTAWIGKLF